ncbi:MAG: FkbM family methyltransferase [Pseudomonadota bacterium]
MNAPTDDLEAPLVHSGLHGTKILYTPHFSKLHRQMIRRGTYERPEIEAGLANVRDGDRVVELGAGAGVVGSILAVNKPGIALRAFEANPHLIDHVTAMYAANGISARASVFNQLVVTEPDAPASLPFHLSGESFMGSNVLRPQTDKDVTVDVPVLRYSDLTAEFPHNALVLDIEGAELAFLAAADLSAVELIIVELHPQIYGDAGAAQCRDILARNGFQEDTRCRQAQVYTFKSSARMELAINEDALSVTPFPDALDFDPAEPLAGGIQTVPGAVMAKREGASGYTFPAAVFDHRKRLVPGAVSWVTPKLAATQDRGHPRMSRVQELPGRWLFGGRYHPHFGHFLTETLSRLWALDHLDQPVKGVVFFPVYTLPADEVANSFKSFAEILDAPFDVKLLDGFHRVEELVVAPQGNGLHELMLGTPEFRQFIKDHIRTDLPPVNCPKLYISRSRFQDKQRRFLGEERLEALLAEEGYTVFHPQEHSWRDQLRHYRGAKQILGPDGSFFHLVNYGAKRNVKVGLIARRKSRDLYILHAQSKWFGIRGAKLFERMARLWSKSGLRSAQLELISEIKFADLGASLAQAGFIPKSRVWEDLTDAELTAELQSIAARDGMDIRQVMSPTEDLSRHPTLADPAKPQVFHLGQRASEPS